MRSRGSKRSPRTWHARCGRRSGSSSSRAEGHASGGGGRARRRSCGTLEAADRRGYSGHVGALPALTYRGTDFYCDVAIPDPGALEVVHEDERVLAFHHTQPFWQVHLVVVPKRHIASLTAAGPEDEADLRALLTVVTGVARRVEREHGAAAVLTNLGDYQDSKHLHIHVHSGARR